MKITRRSLLLAPPVALATARPAIPRTYAWMPKLSENLRDVNPPTLRWLKQLGCKHVDFQGTERVDSDNKGYWTVDDIMRHKKNCDEAEMILESIRLPISLYRQATLGQPGRDEEIDKVCRTIRAMGELGIPVARWNFGPDYLWGNQIGCYDTPGRGGAGGNNDCDYARVKDAPPFEGIPPVGEAEMWERALYFARPIVAAAEKTNVRLALHPNDPPVPVMRGVARIFRSPEAFRRLLKEIPSPVNGLAFCQGTFTEMGTNVFDEIRYFGSRKRINLVHFRNVRGTIPHYREVFIDEGDIDMLQAMKTYKEVGYSGLFVSDHTPRVEGDTPWGHMGRSFSLGYMRALVQAVNSI